MRSRPRQPKRPMAHVCVSDHECTPVVLLHLLLQPGNGVICTCRIFCRRSGRTSYFHQMNNTSITHSTLAQLSEPACGFSGLATEGG
eukprot:COSAG01_NODE_340_length_18638_cov_56.516505_4_plen_87_part_00